MPLRISRRNVYSVGEVDGPTDLETELCPSVIITDGIFPSVIPLLFSGFLVVYID